MDKTVIILWIKINSLLTYLASLYTILACTPFFSEQLCLAHSKLYCDVDASM